MSKSRNRFLRFSIITIIFHSFLFGMDLSEVAKISKYITQNNKENITNNVLYKNLKCINEIGEYCLYKQGRKQYLMKKEKVLKEYSYYNKLVKYYKMAIIKWQLHKEQKVYNYRLDICANLGYFYPFQNPSDCYKLLSLSTKTEKKNIENYLFKQLKD